MMEVFTRQDVRRLAISRQHLDGRVRPPLLEVIRDLGCVQLDPIRQVERTHLLVLWSRLGRFDVAELERLRFQDRVLFEYWAHAASLVLMEEWPVHNWYMRHLQAQPEDKWVVEHWEVIEPLLREIKAAFAGGPKLSRELNLPHDPRFDSRWWSGRFVAVLIDYLWSRGVLTVYGRPENNHRLWGLADEFWPDWTPREVWTEEQVTEFAAQKAIRALGVATPKQIRWHYTRQRYPRLSVGLKKLVQAGKLVELAVVGEAGEKLPGPWYVHEQDMAQLQQIRAGEWHGRTTLLSPFDNLICDRDRTEQLFGFFYRIEIYVPAAKRQYGYYVLPILHQDRLIGRLDMQMDRSAGVLHVHTAYVEAGYGETAVDSIRAALYDLAQFLGATNLQIGTVPPQWATLAGG